MYGYYMEEIKFLLESVKVQDDKFIEAYSGSIYGSIRIDISGEIPCLIRRDVANLFFVLVFSLFYFSFGGLNPIIEQLNFSVLIFTVIRLIVIELRYIEVRRIIMNYFYKKRTK